MRKLQLLCKLMIIQQSLITLKSLLYTHWEVTDNCNHNCLYCYNYWRSTETKKLIVNKNKIKNTYKKIVDELIKNQVYKIIITE